MSEFKSMHQKLYITSEVTLVFVYEVRVYVVKKYMILVDISFVFLVYMIVFKTTFLIFK
jgi:hypothetical protein